MTRRTPTVEHSPTGWTVSGAGQLAHCGARSVAEVHRDGLCSGVAVWRVCSVRGNVGRTVHYCDVDLPVGLRPTVEAAQ